MRRQECLVSLQQNGLTKLPFPQLMKIWQVMDECIRTGVSTMERTLPGRLNLRRRAPMLYQRLMRGYVSSPPSPLPLIPRACRFYPGIHPGSALSIVPGSSASAINAPAFNVNLPNEKSDALFDGNGNGNGNGSGNGNGTKGEKVVNQAPKATRVVGSFDHPLLPMAPVSVATNTNGAQLLKCLQKRTVFPAIDFLSCYAIAVNEVRG
jgi:hypothetical protein